jgi:hypothetical protein
MRQSLNQRGSGHVVLLLAVLVVAVVGFAGYRVMSAKSPADTSDTASANATVPAKLTSKADVLKASNALDQTAVDSSVNPDSLNNDLNSLL